MGWTAAGIYFNTKSPFVVVLSESMSPGFERGDILFIRNDVRDPIKKGDITVFELKGKDIPIVHRVLKVHELYALLCVTFFSPDGTVRFLTKGDNNQVHDRGLYNRGQKWLEPSNVMGVVKGYIPYLGMITIIMNEYPKLKALVLLSLGYFALFTRE